MITAFRASGFCRMSACSVSRFAGLLVAALLAGGCDVDFDLMRREHAGKFPAELSAKTLTALPHDEPVGLADCVRIALANNLDVRTSRIQRRLAGLDRKIAFSNFLPHVNLQMNYQSSLQQQAIGIGGHYQPMSDQSVTTAVLSAQQSIFAPETWFLYDAYTKGEGISELVARRTRDLIRLQVTTLYFACLSQEQSRKSLESSLRQARGLLDETEALVREDLAMASQVEQVRTLVLAQQAALAANQRTQTETRSALLEAMGLSPMAEMSLKTETPLSIERRELADQILQAMLQRPELHVADRTIEIRKDETRIAIAQFVPKLLGVSNLTHSGDSFLKYSNLWSFGVSGVLSVFDGFANIFEYRAARERQKQATIQREQKCMRIMLEVIRARSQHDQAMDKLDVARQELRAVETLLRETRAKWREGLLMNSQELDAVTRHAAALSNCAAAEFQTQVTAATLLDVMGVSPEGSDNEQAR